MALGVIDPNAAPVPVLMYHAVGDLPVRAADPHYTVAWADFGRHLALLRARRLRPASLRSLLGGNQRQGSVALTFDDGHESNAQAASWIGSQGGTADFFVNPSTVGSVGFLDWAGLREMARYGQSIQSHGQTHRYLDELADVEIWRELRDSKARIEDAVGERVTVFAPPGGRMTAAVVRLARQAGYEAICGSVAGLWRDPMRLWPIPRLAVTASIDERRFDRWICQDEVELARMRLRHAALQAAKRLLGNRRYDRLRSVLMHAPQRTDVH
ncbi:MAG TPA: polysaccharide deacetylase family protein [Usitatibacter sp.]|nr:polysaccharide deacetylase family protein [Usitatibacter sp.]